MEALDENFGEPSTGDQPPPPKKKCTQSDRAGNGSKAAAGKERKKLETKKESELSATTKENKSPRIKKPRRKPADKPPTGTILKVSEIAAANTPQIQTPATIPTAIVSPPLPLQSSKTPSPKLVRTRVFSCNITKATCIYTTFQCQTNDPHFPLNTITDVPNQKHSYTKLFPPKQCYRPTWTSHQNQRWISAHLLIPTLTALVPQKFQSLVGDVTVYNLDNVHCTLSGICQ